MSEYFLHYIWQFQYFDKADLFTADGEEVKIFHPGQRNTHSGPDFFNAQVWIGGIEWRGSVEIHINASSWNEHHHNIDAAYENVVLHVVWKNDKPIRRNDGSLLPVIELKNRIAENLLLNMKKLVNSPETIPCSKSVEKVGEITRIAAFDRVLVERLETRSNDILDQYTRSNNDWEETCYQLLCKNFGFRVNSEAFQQLGRALPVKILERHSDKIQQVEALLFGQAGFLDDASMDPYHEVLCREYKLLAAKYGLLPMKLEKKQWRFLRLRPGNFPTLRIAQMAALIHNRKRIFSHLVSINDVKQLKQLFVVEQSPYWTTHYRFFKVAKERVPFLGDASIDNILMNTVVPLLAAYSRWKDDPLYMDRAVIILQEITSEQNAITKLWAEAGIKSKTAFDSQAMIGLYNEYCLKHRCLECTIGHSLLNTSGR